MRLESRRIKANECYEKARIDITWFERQCAEPYRNIERLAAWQLKKGN